VFKSKVLDTDEKFSYTFTKADNPIIARSPKDDRQDSSAGNSEQDRRIATKTSVSFSFSSGLNYMGGQLTRFDVTEEAGGDMDLVHASKNGDDAGLRTTREVIRS